MTHPDRQAELERMAREVILKLQLLPTGHDCCLSGTGGIQVIIEVLAAQRTAVLGEVASELEKYSAQSRQGILEIATHFRKLAQERTP